MKSIFFTLCFAIAFAQSQEGNIVPLALGVGVTSYADSEHPYLPETEITPFIEVDVLDYGHFRLHGTLASIEYSIAEEDFQKDLLSWGTDLYININPIWKNPYFTLGYTSRSLLDDSEVGDRKWAEWKVGFGGTWPVRPGLQLFAQGDYRWSSETVEYEKGVDFNAYKILSLTFGLSAYFY